MCMYHMCIECRALIQRLTRTSGQLSNAQLSNASPFIASALILLCVCVNVWCVCMDVLIGDIVEVCMWMRERVCVCVCVCVCV